MNSCRTAGRMAVAAVFGSVAFSQPAAAPGSVRAFLHNLATEQLAARKQAVAALGAAADVRARQAEIRRRFLGMIGGLPAERTPLNIQRMGVIDREDYRIEKIVFESQPKFYVTANLYVPKTGPGPYPAVVQPTGHSVMAKARAFYQTLSLGLVKSGFVVLTYDPTGQGERRIYYDADLADSKVGGTTVEHEMAGIQSLLAGESIARYMIWDGMRAVDVLQSLAYVDGKRIGVSGCSGGGTLTAYLAALDDRLQAAAPSCYITDWEDQLAGTGPQDAEQQFPDQLRRGLNHADLIAAFAPRPYLIASTAEDFFPIAGSRKAYAESQRIYQLLGAPERVATAYDAGPHGTTALQRRAIYAWMGRWLNGKSGELEPEPSYQTEYEQDLLVTKTGQVSTSLGGETPATLNIKRMAKLLPVRPIAKARLREEVIRLTRFERSDAPLSVKADAPVERPDYRLTHLTYQAAPGRAVAALLAEPAAGKSRRRAVLYLDERGKGSGSAPQPDAEELAQAGYTVLAIDLSGIGENATPWSSYSNSWFGQEKLTWLALMTGRTMVGLRMEDIVRGIDLLGERGLLYGGSCLALAKGSAGVDALHAAAIDSRISGAVIEEMLLSYAAVARHPIHRHVFGSVVPGVLGHYDLPDLAASLAPRPLYFSNLRGPAGGEFFLRAVQAEYAPAAAAYAAAGAQSNLILGLRREQESVREAYQRLF